MCQIYTPVWSSYRTNIWKCSLAAVLSSALPTTVPFHWHWLLACLCSYSSSETDRIWGSGSQVGCRMWNLYFALGVVESRTAQAGGKILCKSGKDSSKHFSSSACGKAAIGSLKNVATPLHIHSRKSCNCWSIHVRQKHDGQEPCGSDTGKHHSHIANMAVFDLQTNNMSQWLRHSFLGWCKDSLPGYMQLTSMPFAHSAFHFVPRSSIYHDIAHVPLEIIGNHPYYQGVQ